MLDMAFALALGIVAWLFFDMITGATASAAVWGAVSLFRLAFRDT